MTPLIFISFLVSLALVDLRYSALRSHYHADADDETHHHRRMPRWLHRIVYRYRGYRYDVAVDQRQGQGQRQVDGGDDDEDGAGSTGRRAPGSRSASEQEVKGGGEYYHSKQRKLMKMEAAEAFEIRGWVMVVLGLLGLAVAWGAWKVASWVVRAVWAWCL
ncbi:hypothetical protein VTK26DRAFT_3934 [Humicola hyalothermophila]